MQGLIGKKIGMTQVWDDQGRRVAVTVIEAGPCHVVQVKQVDRDGYAAAQLGFDLQKSSRLTRPVRVRYDKAGVPACRMLREFPFRDDVQPKVGDSVTVDIFTGDVSVDIVGVTKGRGFAGVVRRYRMGGGPHSHGGHSKRRVGSVGQCELPGRINKNKKMPGHMGCRRVTARNLGVVQIRAEENLLLVRGAVPGANGSYVLVNKALRKG